MQTFVYVSTAYSVPGEDIIEEKVYKSPYNPHVLFECLDIVPADMLKVFTQNVLVKLIQILVNLLYLENL